MAWRGMVVESSVWLATVLFEQWDERFWRHKSGSLPHAGNALALNYRPDPGKYEDMITMVPRKRWDLKSGAGGLKTIVVMAGGYALQANPRVAQPRPGGFTTKLAFRRDIGSRLARL